VSSSKAKFVIMPRSTASARSCSLTPAAKIDFSQSAARTEIMRGEGEDIIRGRRLVVSRRWARYSRLVSGSKLCEARLTNSDKLRQPLESLFLNSCRY
jgi:hypothetical protein